MWHTEPEQLVVSIDIDGSPPLLLGNVIGAPKDGGPAAVALAPELTAKLARP